MSPARSIDPLVVADADAARDELIGRGIDASEVDEQPWGRFVYITDPDGNKWSLQELPKRSSGRLRSIDESMALVGMQQRLDGRGKRDELFGPCSTSGARTILSSQLFKALACSLILAISQSSMSPESRRSAGILLSHWRFINRLRQVAACCALRGCIYHSVKTFAASSFIEVEREICF